jgi:tetratricopeptide (TPR) repeat protein
MAAEQELLSLNAEAEALMGAGRHAEALPVYRAFVARLKSHFGAQHEDTLAGLNNLGILLHTLHINAEAELHLTAALDGKRRVLRADDETLADTCKNLADVLRDQGARDRAAPLYEEALAQCRRLQGDTHPASLEVMDDLAECLLPERPERALALLQESLVAKRRRLGDSAPDTQATKARVTALLRDVLGRGEEAAQLEQLVGDGTRASPGAALVRAISGGGGGSARVLSASPRAADAGGGGGGGTAGLSPSAAALASSRVLGGAGATVTNPLTLASMAAQRSPSSRLLSAAPQQQQPQQLLPHQRWRRYEDAEANPPEVWYVNGDGESVWELPPDGVLEEDSAA